MANQDYTVSGELSPDGRSLVIANAARAVRLWKHLIGVELEINFKKFYKKRSLAQNRWIWGVCVPTVIQFLYDTEGVVHSKEAVYSFLRTRVLGDEAWVETIEGQDTIYLGGKRFSQMTTKEFSEAVEKIVAYYLERDVEIPLPIPKTNNLITDYAK
jgi:hypothetical protein